MPDAVDALNGRPFRAGDTVTVHGYMRNYLHSQRAKGRVVCTNRKTQFMCPIVVLIDIGDCEAVECFCSDGTRYLQGDTVTISLGWEVQDGIPQEG